MRFTAQPGMFCLNEEGKKTPPDFRPLWAKAGGVFFNYLAIGLAFLPIL